MTVIAPPTSSREFDVWIPLPLKARAGHRCALQGIPAITISAGSWSVRADPPDTLPLQPTAALSPGHDSVAAFQWSGPACSRSRPVTVSVSLPHRGGTVTVPWTTAYVCPGHDSSRQSAHLQADPLGTHSPQGDPGWDAPFVTRMIEQHSVKPGGDIHYRVQLTMMRGSAAKPPCYGYRESLINPVTFAVVANEEHTLDCAGLSPLGRLGTVWDMQVHVPDSVPIGSLLEVGWECDIPGCYNESSPHSDYVSVDS